MKILVISQYFYPENFRINDFVTALIKRGHDVTVVTGLPNYPEGEVFEGYENAYKTISLYNGAKVYRSKLRPRHTGTINLVANYLSFVKKTNQTLKKIKPNFDLIYFYEPSPIFSGIPAIKYGKKHHIPTVIYNLDIWPDCVRDSRKGKTMSKSNPIFIFSKIISKYVYRHFDLILNKCDEFGEYLEKVFKIDKEKMVTLFEPADNLYLEVDEKPIDNGLIDFMFVGNIGKVQNCDLIVRAFSQVNNSNAVLHFVGEGSYLDELKKITVSLGMNDKVVFHGKKPIDEIIKYYNLADICILALSNATASGLTPPAKLMGYLASSRPVVASINGAGKTIINNAKCGLTCPADDVESLAELMRYAINNYHSFCGVGKNGRKYFLDHFTLEKHISAFEKIISTKIINH